jgi:hypothetical protein
VALPLPHRNHGTSNERTRGLNREHAVARHREEAFPDTHNRDTGRLCAGREPKKGNIAMATSVLTAPVRNAIALTPTQRELMQQGYRSQPFAPVSMLRQVVSLNCEGCWGNDMLAYPYWASGNRCTILCRCAKCGTETVIQNEEARKSRCLESEVA